MIAPNAPSVKEGPATFAPLAGEPLWRRRGYSCYITTNRSVGGTFLSYDVELREPAENFASETLAVVAADPYRTRDEAMAIARWIALDPDVLDRATGKAWRGVIDRRPFLRGDGKPLSEITDYDAVEQRANEAARTGRMQRADAETAAGQGGKPLPWHRPGWRVEVREEVEYDGETVSYRVTLNEPGDIELAAGDTLAVVYAAPYRTKDEAEVVAEHIAGDLSYLDRSGGAGRVGIVDRRSVVAAKFAGTGAAPPADKPTDDEQPADLADTSDTELRELSELGQPLPPCLARPGMVAFVTEGKVRIEAVLESCCVYRKGDGTFGACDWEGVTIDVARPDPRFIPHEPAPAR